MELLLHLLSFVPETDVYFLRHVCRALGRAAVRAFVARVAQHLNVNCDHAALLGIVAGVRAELGARRPELFAVPAAAQAAAAHLPRPPSVGKLLKKAAVSPSSLVAARIVAAVDRTGKGGLLSAWGCSAEELGVIVACAKLGSAETFG